MKRILEYHWLILCFIIMIILLIGCSNRTKFTTPKYEFDVSSNLYQLIEPAKGNRQPVYYRISPTNSENWYFPVLGSSETNRPWIFVGSPR